MKKYLKHICIIVLLFAGSVYGAAQVVFEARVDTMVLMIGEQRELTLDLTCNANQKVKMPHFTPQQPLVDGVEVVDFLGSDTISLQDGSRQQIQQRWSITAFDSALVALPPFEAEVDGKQYQTKSIILKIFTMDIDTLHLDQYFPPKDIQKNPFSWYDWKPIFGWSVLLLVVVIALCYVVIRFYQNKPIIRIVKKVIMRPAHQVAMEEIERIKSERKWASEDSKEYYTLLTDTLRKYIKERYGFNATEMTSSEIIERLLQENNQEVLAELQSLFQTADLVKFAKWTTLMNENDMNLVNAIDFINQTKVEIDPNAKPEPAEITIEEKQNRTRSIVMRSIIAAFAVIAIALLAYVSWLIFDLVH